MIGCLHERAGRRVFLLQRPNSGKKVIWRYNCFGFFLGEEIRGAELWSPLTLVCLRHRRNPECVCVCVVDAEVMWRECSRPQERTGHQEHAGIPTLRRALRISTLMSVSSFFFFVNFSLSYVSISMLFFSRFSSTHVHRFPKYLIG